MRVREGHTGLKSCGNIDAMPLDAGVTLAYLAKVDADAKGNRIRPGIPHRIVAELSLHFDGKIDCLRGILEQCEYAVTSNVLYLATVITGERFNQIDGTGNPFGGLLFIPRHQSAVAMHIGKQDRREIGGMYGSIRQRSSPSAGVPLFVIFSVS